MRFTLFAACGLLVLAPSLVVAQVPVPGPFPPTFVPAPPPMTVVERNRNLIPVLLEAALKDKNEVVRRNASEALRGLGSDAIPSLVDLLKGKDNDLRAGAAVLLGNMGPKAEVALPTLLSILKNKKEPEDLRQKVSRTIALLVGSGPVSKAGTPGGELQLASFTTESKPAQPLEGRWKRVGADGELNLSLRAGRLHLTWSGVAKDKARTKVSIAIDADYAVTKDSLIYGVFTGFRLEPLSEAPAFPPCKILDVPFSIRYRVDGKRLTLKSPHLLGQTDADFTLAGPDDPTITGEYTRSDVK